MSGPPVVVAIDWGTTRMRGWLLDEAGEAVAEHRGDHGMTAARDIGFPVVLERTLTALDAPAGLPVIACGMVGAKQGWVEAPYTDVPSSIGAILRGAVNVPGISVDMRIVPGLAQRDADAPDVMRGEETQLAGAGLPGTGRHIVCMPGTHSKWVVVEDGAVRGFHTWPTGELFAVLAQHSILRHSLGDKPPAVLDDPVFVASSKRALAEGGDVTARLFAIRAGSLLHGLSPAGAAATLSGLLIGGEIASARRHVSPDDGKVVLIASGALAGLYRAALALSYASVETVDADVAVRHGLFAAARENGMLGRRNP